MGDVLKLGQLHHLEYCVADLEATRTFWSPFLGRLSYREHQNWSEGFSFIHETGTYLVFVRALQVPVFSNRKIPGLDHFAFCGGTIADLAALRLLLLQLKAPIRESEPNYLCFEDPNGFVVEVFSIAGAASAGR